MTKYLFCLWNSIIKRNHQAEKIFDQSMKKDLINLLNKDENVL